MNNYIFGISGFFLGIILYCAWEWINLRRYKAHIDSLRPGPHGTILKSKLKELDPND